MRLVMPPGGRVPAPFAGTGTTGGAAALEGFDAILVEREPGYQEDTAPRIQLVAGPSVRQRTRHAA